MKMSNQGERVYLITGATRGIGKNLTTQLLAQDNTTVIAAVRKIEDANAKALASHPAGKDSRVVLVKIDGAIESDAQEAIDSLKSSNPPIDHIDVVIANAAINESKTSVRTTDGDNVRKTVDINIIAPLSLFKATQPLLKGASKQSGQLAKFAIVTSLAGSLDFIAKSPLSNLSYSVSKAGVNVLGARIAYEEPDIITLLLHPGLVGTDMLDEFFERMPEIKEAFQKERTLTPEESAAHMLHEIAKATKADSGRFIDAPNGTTIPW